ncbi:MAG: dihydrofolate reductase family protein [Gammaproteobacteria bacterium]
MHRPLTRLIPAPQQDVKLAGLYLAQHLHNRGNSRHPFVYSNFITSLDGRIALAGEHRQSHEVPPTITNARDWRLYQELAGQADILITSGRYFRQSIIGEAQDKLPVSSQPDYEDIRQWRQEQGLAVQPDIAIMSASLDIPLESLAPYHKRKIYVFTGEQADPERVHLLEHNGATVMQAGAGHQVEGKRMIELLATEGYRSIYAIAGPWVFHTLLEARVVNRLYLTMACQLLGGSEYDTLLEGPLLSPARGMQAVGLYHDPFMPSGGQLLGIFEPVALTPTDPGRS